MNKTRYLLEDLRKGLNFSQTVIAEILKVSRPTYILLEKGEKELTLTQAKALSDLYNVPVEAIRTGKLEQDFSKNKEIVEANLPTEFGEFVFGVWNQKKGDEIIYLRTKNLNNTRPALVRVHSECMTGDTFKSLRCDCGTQKDESLRMIAENGNGILIYLRQEGRGIGLYEKIKAYLLQDAGYDTHEANILLGHKPDYREYSWVKKVLDNFGIKEIKLITNNPSKISEISQLGIKVIDRVSLVIASNMHNRKYFETKKNKFKHFFGKDESNYFYQFSYVDTPEQVEEIGNFLKNKQKDPLLKICIGIYVDSHLLEDRQEIKKVDAILKMAEFFEGFVPIIHFTFKYSPDPIVDIAKLRDKLPAVKYIQLNDLENNHLEVLRFANKFFLVDIPLTNSQMNLLDNDKFVAEIINKKTFVLLDNSHGTGKQDSKSNIIKNINLLLSKNINDIAIYGGFGADSLNLYFDIKEHYKFNLSIDAETKLKSNGQLDLAKVKDYLEKLISHSKDSTISTDTVTAFKEVFCDENQIIKDVLKDKFLEDLKGVIVDVGGGRGDILADSIPDKNVLHLDVLDFSDVSIPKKHTRLVGNFLEEETIKKAGKVDTLFMSHVLQFIDSDLDKLRSAIDKWNADRIILVEDLNNDFLGEVLRFSKDNFANTNGEEQLPGFPNGYTRIKSVPFTATLKCKTFDELAEQCLYIMDLEVSDKNIQAMQQFLEEKLDFPSFKINQEVNLYAKS